VTQYDGVVLAVAHEEFKDNTLEHLKEGTVLYDVKSFFPKEKVTSRL